MGQVAHIENMLSRAGEFGLTREQAMDEIDHNRRHAMYIIEQHTTHGAEPIPNGEFWTLRGAQKAVADLSENLGWPNLQIVEEPEELPTPENSFPRLTQGLLDAIAEHMDDEIREALSSARDWSHPGQFLTAYMAEDPEFPLHQFQTEVG